MLKSLNQAQKKAVLHDKGPLLILAGAGSGKTRALTHRLAYLVKEKRVSPLNILCLTFTNKAAAEMISRVTRLLTRNPKSQIPNHKEFGNWKLEIGNYGKSADFPFMGTFHSVCAKILRREIIHLNQGFTPGFTIFDEDDSTRLIKKIMVEINLDPKKFSPEAIKSYISRAKNELISPLKYRGLTDSIFTETVARIYPLYEKKLKELNALDFDNLINKLIELWQKELRVLERYQRLFKYILVDEYQDTNHSQYLLLKLLTQKQQNICVVGDDWQSIYRFRGADFRNILAFKKDYPQAKIIKLEENYRSTGHILKAAQSVIKNNTLRSEKNLYSHLGSGKRVKLVETRNHETEGEFIIKTINVIANQQGEAISRSPRLPSAASRRFADCRVAAAPRNDNKEQLYLNQSVILYRTHAQSRSLEEVMLRNGIPYRIIGGVRFYQRKEIKDVLAYLRLIENSQDLISLNRIINLPPRGISHNTLRQLRREDLEHIARGQTPQSANYHRLKPTVQNKIANFISLIAKIRLAAKEQNILRLIPHVVKITGYKDYILDGSEEGLARFENINELLSVAGKYSPLKPGESLRDFLVEVALLSDLDNLDSRIDALTLMTMHNAKGLEFDNVFIAGTEEDLIPHSRSRDEPDELEEERRLFYVAMTRAKKRLYLIYTQKRLLWGSERPSRSSRFIDEIDSAHAEYTNDSRIESTTNGSLITESQVREIDLKIGDSIFHQNFGEGRVIAVDDQEVIVNFANLGKRRLAVNYAPMKKI